MTDQKPIGVFDSGFGGLTILRDIMGLLPNYDYLYLGDNARAPYGNRSFDTVYQYTLEAVKWLFGQGCELVILACNTASAKALRNIQQLDLPLLAPERRVLGVIRPTSEIIGKFSKTGNLGIFATKGTVVSESYLIEMEKFFPGLKVTQVACPLFVPLIENNEHAGDGADYFVKKYINQLLEISPDTDTLLLACTHYPIIKEKIRSFLPENIQIVEQGPIVAESLKDYLNRHQWMHDKISKNGILQIFTTDDPGDFDEKAKLFIETNIKSHHLDFHQLSLQN